MLAMMQKEEKEGKEEEEFFKPLDTQIVINSTLGPRLPSHQHQEAGRLQSPGVRAALSDTAATGHRQPLKRTLNSI